MRNFIFLFTPWWGKIIGIPLGYLAGGPAGAVFGILIGNLFDIGFYNILNTPQWHLYRRASNKVKNIFLPTLFQTMGHIAKTDGHVTPEDIKVARTIMRELRLFGANKQLAMRYYNDGKKPTYDFEKKLRVIRQLCYYDKDLLSLFSKTQYRAAHTQTISNAKKDKINMVYSLLGFVEIYPERRKKNKSNQTNQQQSQQKNHQYKNTSNNKRTYTYTKTDYEILGVSNGERAELVKKSYRKLMSKNHPDKLIARNASKQEIEKATEQAQLIRAAYERIKKSRGF